MKYLLLVVAISLAHLAAGQSGFPDFLPGTWKRENRESYEHWDQLNDKTLKGFSYELQDGQMLVSEYLEINQNPEGTVYTTSVMNQNQGKSIAFKLVKTDSTFTFENPGHDFPQTIVYQKRSDAEIFVQVLGGNKRGFSYRMIKQNTKDTTTENPNYNPALAEKSGGDDYGMKSYFFVLLKTGINQTTDKAFISETFRGHLSNINRLVDEKKLIVAGPLEKNENNYRGIFILNNIRSMTEARDLLQTDPAIKNKLLDYEIFTWYGPAALPAYLPVSDKIWKLKP